MDNVRTKCSGDFAMIRIMNPKASFLSHECELMDAIKNVCHNGTYIMGDETAAFEKEFADFVGSNYAISVSSGTAALFLSLKVLGIGVGDEVITVSHTATATASAIEASGAKVVFVDVEPEFMTISPDHLSRKITKNTKAIIAVHIYGNACDMTALTKFCDTHNLFLIEDCAQATGTKYCGKHVGTLGTVGCFSFFPTKNLGALGDGGMVTTNDKEIYQQLILLRQYGWDSNRVSQRSGYNCRLDEIQAAILRVKLRKIDKEIKKRNEIAQFYIKRLKDTKLELPLPRPHCNHAYHLFVIRSESRDNLCRNLLSNGVETLIHYKVPVHQQRHFCTSTRLKVTEEISKKILSIPLYPELTLHETNKISELLSRY